MILFQCSKKMKMKIRNLKNCKFSHFGELFWEKVIKPYLIAIESLKFRPLKNKCWDTRIWPFNWNKLYTCTYGHNTTKAALKVIPCILWRHVTHTVGAVFHVAFQNKNIFTLSYEHVTFTDLIHLSSLTEWVKCLYSGPLLKTSWDQGTFRRVLEWHNYFGDSGTNNFLVTVI